MRALRLHHLYISRWPVSDARRKQVRYGGDNISNACNAILFVNVGKGESYTNDISSYPDTNLQPTNETRGYLLELSHPVFISPINLNNKMLRRRSTRDLIATSHLSLLIYKHLQSACTHNPK